MLCSVRHRKSLVDIFVKQRTKKIHCAKHLKSHLSQEETRVCFSIFSYSSSGYQPMITVCVQNSNQFFCFRSLRGCHHREVQSLCEVNSPRYTDYTFTPGSCCVSDLRLSGCQPASLFLCRWMFLGQVSTMSPLSTGMLTYVPAPLKWQSRWQGKYREEDKKREISWRRREASCGAPDVWEMQSRGVGRGKGMEETPVLEWNKWRMVGFLK